MQKKHSLEKIEKEAEELTPQEQLRLTEIYRECLQNPLGEYHRYRFQGEGVRLKMKMTD